MSVTQISTADVINICKNTQNPSCLARSYVFMLYAIKTSFSIDSTQWCEETVDPRTRGTDTTKLWCYISSDKR